MKYFLHIVFMISTSIFAYAEDSTVPVVKTENSIDFYQKIIDEYKTYVANIKPEIKEEVQSFRNEISRINKQKRDLYKSLSQEAQDYLNKEREFKKKLPNAKKTNDITGHEVTKK